MKKTTFRIFDCKAQKYIAPTDKSNFSLSITGEVISPKKTPADSKFEVAYSLPILDINGKQPFTDDDVMFLVGKKVKVGSIGFSKDYKVFVGISEKREFIVRDFEILPNREERAAGKTWEDILKAWDDKAAAITEPISVAGPGNQTEDNKDPLFYRAREYSFADMRLVVTLSSEGDMSEEAWAENFDNAMRSTDVFIAAHPEPKAIPSDYEFFMSATIAGAERKATEEFNAHPLARKYEPRVILDAKKLVDMPIGPAPLEWNAIREISHAYPKVPNCEKVLNRFGDTDLAQWYIGRHGNFNVASEVFLITKTPVEDNESSNVSK